MNSRMNIEKIGVATSMKSVSFQLMNHRNTKLPRNWTKLLSRTEMLSLAADCTTPISLVSLLIS